MPNPTNPDSLPLIGILATLAWVALAAYVLRNPKHPRN